jgi:hypothetical protein
MSILQGARLKILKPHYTHGNPTPPPLFFPSLPLKNKTQESGGKNILSIEKAWKAHLSHRLHQHPITSFWQALVQPTM